MKTPHRIMYEALPRDVYWKWCKSTDIKNPKILIDHTPSYILRCSFWWDESYDGRDYWERVALNLESGNYKRESER